MITKRSMNDGKERCPTHPGAILREDILPARTRSLCERGGETVA
jgi:hypothetical protein